MGNNHCNLLHMGLCPEGHGQTNEEITTLRKRVKELEATVEWQRGTANGFMESRDRMGERLTAANERMKELDTALNKQAEVWASQHIKLTAAHAALKTAKDALESCDFDDQQLKLGMHYDEAMVDDALAKINEWEGE